MSNPVISAIVPVFNAEHTLDRCIKSILSQTYSPIEIVLVNDGSRDGSLERCRYYEQRHGNIRVINKPNTGVSDTRNVGILASTGEYIIFVDSDDYIESTMCRELADKMVSSNADLCLCTMNVIRNGKKYTEHIEEGLVIGMHEIALMAFKIYKTNYINSPCNKLYKKGLITSLFPKGVSLGEDLIFNLDYIENCNMIYFMDKALYNYEFSNSSSLTSLYREDSFELSTLIYTRIREFGIKCGVNFKDMNTAREVYMNMMFYAVQDLFYYTGIDKKAKINTLKKWFSCQEAMEVCGNTEKLPLQQKYAAYLIYHKAYTLLSAMFIIKRLLSPNAAGKGEINE